MHRSGVVAVSVRGPDSSGRRDALVRSAFDCIAEFGFEGLRLRMVATRVGIDHSTLHHYFATKDDLVGAVLQHVTRQFWDTMNPVVEPAERLRLHLSILGRMTREQPALFLVLDELESRGRRDEAVGVTIRAGETGWRAALTDLFREGVDAGVWLPELDIPATVELVIATIKGVRLAPDRAETTLSQLWILLTDRARLGISSGTAETAAEHDA